MKKFVRSNRNPIAQVVKRVVKLENCASTYSRKELHSKVSIARKDRWCILENGEFISIRQQQNENYFVCDVIHQDKTENVCFGIKV